MLQEVSLKPGRCSASPLAQVVRELVSGGSHLLEDVQKE